MNELKANKFWFITGSQHLYGESTLQQVAMHSKEIAAYIDTYQTIPCTVIFKPVVTSSGDITTIIRQANDDHRSMDFGRRSSSYLLIMCTHRRTHARFR